MTSKEELSKRFKEERTAREKARIQMLHDMNRKKYSNPEENAWKFPLHLSDYTKSPVKNSMYQRGPSFVRAGGQRVKNYNYLHGSVENGLNVTAPVSSNGSMSNILSPNSRSMHNKRAEHNASIEYLSSPTVPTDVAT